MSEERMSFEEIRDQLTALVVEERATQQWHDKTEALMAGGRSAPRYAKARTTLDMILLLLQLMAHLEATTNEQDNTIATAHNGLAELVDKLVERIEALEAKCAKSS